MPEGIPAEGLKILRAEDEQELERQFAKHVKQGYVPAQKLEVEAKLENGEWRTLYVMPMWKVGNGGEEAGEEMYR